MNLVISGMAEAALREAVAAATMPLAVVPLQAGACRFDGIVATSAVRAQVSDLCDRGRTDHAFLDSPPGLQHFGLLAMDMDSTLITIECIDEIADYAGKKREVAAITEAAMRGECTDFAESLRRRVALLAGLDIAVLQRVFDERLQFSPGAETLVRAAKSAGVTTVVVSGGFTFFTDRLVESLGLDAGYANSLAIADGRLTGRVNEPIVDAAEKATFVETLLLRNGLKRSQAIVVGDGFNDIPMMGCVDHSVAYHGKPPAMAAARHRVRYGTLSTVVDFFG